MKTNVAFESILISPCGLYCGACSGYLRTKNKCPGCRINSGTKPVYCVTCRIVNCELLSGTNSGFCYECEKFPCQRLRQLDRRYRTKYNTGLIQNLDLIREKGIDTFLKAEKKKRTCRKCGSILCIHQTGCTICKTA